MGGGECSKGPLKEEVEQAGSLEPDPRYIRCCSAVCRPGHALRDALLGLLVLLGLSVVVTVIFVVCFYVIPDEKQLIEDGILPGSAEGSFQGPGGVNGANEITLKDNEKYTLPPHSFGDDDPSHSQDFSTFATFSDGLPDSTDSTRQLHKEENPNLSSADANRFGTINEFDGQRADVIEDFEGREASEGGHLPGERGHLPGEGSHFSSEGGHHPREGGHFAGEESRDRNGPQHNLGHRGERPFVFENEQEHGVMDGPSKPVAGGGSDGDGDGGPVPFPSGSNVQNNGCRAVQLPMCSSTVPWTLAGTSNWMNHTSDAELFAAMPYIKSVLLDSGCSELAPLYACSILEPACRDLTVLPPCRSFCTEVSHSCQSPEHSSDVSGLFDCGRFPDSQDPNVCISAQRGVTSMRPKLSSHLPPASFADGSNVKLSTDRSNVDSFTGISFPSQGDDDFIPTSFTPTLNGLTTSFEFAESETTQAVVFDPTPSATMSLADRLKLAMSSSTASTFKPNTPRALTERTQRHSNTPKVLVTSAPDVNSVTNSAGMSLADRLSSVSSVTTERIFRFKHSSNKNTRFSEETSITTTERVASLDIPHSDIANVESTGILSLAELLALSNKAKPTRTPENRSQPRRVSSSNGNRFTDQMSAGTASTTQRIDATSSRIRFRGSSSPTVQSLTSQEDGDRRIPVRTVEEVPKVRFNFPMRNPAREPVTFRTTSELPKITTQDAPTTRKIERPLHKFVLSTSTSENNLTSTTISESTPASTSTSESTPTSTSESTPASIPTATTTSTSTTTESTTSTSGNNFLTCPELQCLDGKCITINQLNDGVIDCSDGSDEQDFGGLVT